MNSRKHRWISLLVAGVVGSLLWLSFLETPQQANSQTPGDGVTIAITASGFQSPRI